MALEVDPTEETMRILSEIQNLMSDANEVCALFEPALRGERNMNVLQLRQGLLKATATLKAQNKMLINLSEKQIQLDERLCAIVASMPKE